LPRFTVRIFGMFWPSVAGASIAVEFFLLKCVFN